jgi:hypothetical protein
MSPATPDVPELLLHWERTVGALLDRTASFPKVVRFTFAARIEGLALDVLDALVRARWASGPEKRPHLVKADADLAVLRVLVRLAFERRYLARGGFEHVVRALDEAGRMLGGWRRQAGA